MKQTLRILSLLLLACTMTCWAQPVQAARLATVTGEAGDQEVRDEDSFVLSEQSTVDIGYRVNDLGEACAVQVRLYREQNNRWLVVNTVLTTNTNANGSTRITLPHGDYRIVVIAVQARYHVTVDRD